ncbi:MAG: hypothetical protein OYH77_00965 [Pseudomonadota bacterium]|nr:hypothetical protein [Pseudomonadota bacterium]
MSPATSVSPTPGGGDVTATPVPITPIPTIPPVDASPSPTAKPILNPEPATAPAPSSPKPLSIKTVFVLPPNWKTEVDNRPFRLSPACKDNFGITNNAEYLKKDIKYTFVRPGFKVSRLGFRTENPGAWWNTHDNGLRPNGRPVRELKGRWLDGVVGKNNCNETTLNSVAGGTWYGRFYTEFLDAGVYCSAHGINESLDVEIDSVDWRATDSTCVVITRWKVANP